MQRAAAKSRGPFTEHRSNFGGQRRTFVNTGLTLLAALALLPSMASAQIPEVNAPQAIAVESPGKTEITTPVHDGTVQIIVPSVIAVSGSTGTRVNDCTGTQVPGTTNIGGQPGYGIDFVASVTQLTATARRWVFTWRPAGGFNGSRTLIDPNTTVLGGSVDGLQWRFGNAASVGCGSGSPDFNLTVGTPWEATTTLFELLDLNGDVSFSSTAFNYLSAPTASEAAGTIGLSIPDMGSVGGGRMTFILDTNFGPNVLIQLPADGLVAPLGVQILFSGLASDPEDGPLTPFIVWTSNLSGLIGIGGAVLAALPAGDHLVTATITDSGGRSASDAHTVHVVGADLAITKTDGVTSATPGGTVTYTIVAGNAGPSSASGVSVTDTFPVGLSCSWTSFNAGGASGNSAGSGNLADTLAMPSGSSVTYTALCDIEFGATGTLSNTTTISSAVHDPNPANNSATDNDTVLLYQSGGAGPDLHVRFDGDVLDWSRNLFDGTPAGGGPQFSPGVLGLAGDFDGVDDTVTFASYPDNFFGTNDFTVAFWFHVGTVGRQSLLSKRAVCNAVPFIDVRTVGDRIRLELSNGVSTFESSAIFTENWHHFAGVREGATLRVYLNGSLADENPTGSVLDIEDPVNLGIGTSACIGIDGTVLLQGSLDDLRIYSRALDESAINALIPFFADSFEFGDTLGWSTTTP